jgi:hypothetical protein
MYIYTSNSSTVLVEVVEIDHKHNGLRYFKVPCRTCSCSNSSTVVVVVIVELDHDTTV